MQGLSDRNPPLPGELQVIVLSQAQVTAQAEVATVAERLPAYPDPPAAFEVPEEVDAMWENYNNYFEERYPLLPLAYSCYTLLLYAVDASNDAEAADKLCVSSNVLKELRRRSSYLGTKRNARKLDTQSAFRPPTDQEVRWFERVLESLIKRLGEYAADPKGEWPKITLANFPKLPQL
jgi:hypothetical protein